MLPCATCAYKENLAGNAHISCGYDWLTWTMALADELKGSPTLERQRELADTIQSHPLSHQVSKRVIQWYAFPFNYDPLWGPDACPGFATVADPVKKAPASPMREVLKVLGGRL